MELHELSERGVRPVARIEAVAGSGASGWVDISHGARIEGPSSGWAKEEEGLRKGIEHGWSLNAAMRHDPP
jgi:hypothetical protein